MVCKQTLRQVAESFFYFGHTLRGVLLILFLLPGMAFSQADRPYFSGLIGGHYYTSFIPELGVSRSIFKTKTGLRQGTFKARSFSQSLSVEGLHYDPWLLGLKYSMWTKRSFEKGNFSGNQKDVFDFFVLGFSVIYYSDLGFSALAIRPEVGLSFPRLLSENRSGLWRYRRIKLTAGMNLFLQQQNFAQEIQPFQFSVIFFAEQNKMIGANERNNRRARKSMTGRSRRRRR